MPLPSKRSSRDGDVFEAVLGDNQLVFKLDAEVPVLFTDQRFNAHMPGSHRSSHHQQSLLCMECATHRTIQRRGNGSYIDVQHIWDRAGDRRRSAFHADARLDQLLIGPNMLNNVPVRIDHILTGLLIVHHVREISMQYP